MDKAIEFNKLMAKSYAIGGASAQEQHASMYQLIQGLGSGTLQGDELRSVREGAQVAYQYIEKYAQELYGTSDSLKDLASEGKINSEIVTEAILQNQDAINAAFDNTKMTFGQMWTTFKNDAVMAFRPVMKKMNEILNSEKFQQFVSDFTEVIYSLATATGYLLDGVAFLFSIMAWSIGDFKPVIWSVIALLSVLIGYFIATKVHAVAAFVAAKIKAIGAAVATNVFKSSMQKAAFYALLLAAAVGAGALTYDLMRDAGYGAAKAMGIALVVVGALTLAFMYFGVTAQWAWAVALWPVALVIAAILLVVGLFLTFTDTILGAIYWALAVIWNIIVGVVNGIIQFFWTRFVEPFIGIIEWILNACNGGFDSFGGAVANLIGQIISWFLSLGKVVTKIIDAIFGTNWTAGLNSLQDKVLEWGKKEDASITISREAPELLGRLDATDAWALGNEHGEWLNGKVDWWLEGFGGDSENPYENFVDEQTDPKLEETIADNTGATAKNTEKTSEDLSYLRDLAEMETINRFTTAEIHVDMTNNNHIENGNDLDGLVTHLRDKLYEEMNVVATGVHY
jgi:tape measure domain-containing protein